MATTISVPLGASFLSQLCLLTNWAQLGLGASDFRAYVMQLLLGEGFRLVGPKRHRRRSV